jgi:hypothetical protein
VPFNPGVLSDKNWEDIFDDFFQGCQMVSFVTKNPNLGKFWWALDGKTLIYFRATWNILRTFEILYDNMVHFLYRFCIMHQEKSGNPDWMTFDQFFAHICSAAETETRLFRRRKPRMTQTSKET